MSLQQYQQELDRMASEYHQRAGQAQRLKEQAASLDSRINDLDDQLQVAEEARLLLNKAGAEARESARLRLETTVTDALRYVYGPEFRFIIEIDEGGKRAEAEFYVESISDGEAIRNKPEDSRGGGVIDLISIALRVSLIQIHSNPSIKGPIILDEPGKHVSADYTMKLATFLKQMSAAFGRQIIISTHQSDLASIADEQIEVEMKGGRSYVNVTANN